MVQLTEKAIGKVKEILDSQEPKPAGLRIAVVGGGCSGFKFSNPQVKSTCGCGSSFSV